MSVGVAASTAGALDGVAAVDDDPAAEASDGTFAGTDVAAAGAAADDGADDDERDCDDAADDAAADDADETAAGAGLLAQAAAASTTGSAATTRTMRRADRLGPTRVWWEFTGCPSDGETGPSAAEYRINEASGASRRSRL